MTEKHNADETSETNSSTPVNRRRFVKSLGAAGVAAVGFTGVSAAKGDVDREVTELERGRRGKVIDTVMSDNHARKIRTKFQKDGWKPNVDDGKYISVKLAERNSYRAAIIPFEKDGAIKDEQRNLIWIEKEYADGVDVPYVTGQQAVKTDLTASVKTTSARSELGWESARSGLGWEVTTYTVGENEIETNTTVDGIIDQQDEQMLGPQGHIGPGPGGDCSCIKFVTYCDHVDYFCIAVYITATIGLVASCCRCKRSQGTFTKACALCLNTGIGAGLSFYSCDGVHSCHSEYVCFEQDSMCDSECS
jgi:hypothetical protein